jgi:hypothetical protein
VNTTGTTLPAVGSGTVSLVGGTTASFATGSTSDGTPTADNSGWNTAGYPAATSGNKSAGVQFQVSTRGYSNIVVTWDQRVSTTASRYFRFLYTINGTDFTEVQPAISLVGSNAFFAQSVSLVGVPGVDDNVNFGFRVLSEFERTATGTGAEAYVAHGNYGANGTVRFDAVRISGDALNVENAPPSIEPISDQATVENLPITGVPVLVGDFETPLDQLTFRVQSSNPSLIPPANVVVIGLETDRLMTITPAPDQYGESTIVLSVVDAEGLTASSAFKVTVAAGNLPPTIAPIPHQRMVAGGAPIEIPVTISDTETALDQLVLTVTTGNADILPAANIEQTGFDGNRTLRATPVSGALGVVTIGVKVTDGGGRSASTSFALMVVPSESVLVYDQFTYGGGSLITNSARFWDAHSGTTGQVQVLPEGVLRSSFSWSEDVHVAFAGDPLNTGAIYTSFEATFTALPLNNEYFAHLNYAGNFRARIFCGTNNATPGAFRLGIGNFGNTGIGQLSADLNLDTVYTVVTRYDVQAATSTIWVNPLTESDAGATATDSTSATPVSGFSFRNASGIGNMRIDNLKIGRSFADVVSGAADRVSISIEVVNDVIELSWPASATGFRLQGNPGVNPADWVDETEIPSVEGGRNVVRLPGVTDNRFYRLIR